MATFPADVKHILVNAAADGDNAVIAAVASKSIRVLGFVLTNATTAGLSKLQDTAGSPVVHAQFNLAVGGAVSYAGGLEAPAFQTAAGTGVEVNNGTGVDTHGFITYVEI